MLRYIAIATVLVAVAIVAVTNWGGHVRGVNGRTRYVTATGTPGPPQQTVGVKRPVAAVSGIAPWILSALPDCFTQTREVRGRRAYVFARIGRGLSDVPAGSGVRSGDCTVVRRKPAELTVYRGHDVDVSVPSVAAFVETPQAPHAVGPRTLVLVVRDGRGFILRRYRTRRGAVALPCTAAQPAARPARSNSATLCR